MIQSAANTYLFRLGRKSYLRTSLLAVLLLAGYVLCAFVSAALAMHLYPTYAHTFTPYVKWQDALVALCWYITFISLGGCVLIGRFLFALRAGYTSAMLVVSDSALIVRDLSHENLSSIFWLVGTSLTCALIALAGLLPEMLLGWTLNLSSPLLVVPATGVAIALSLAGLALTLPFLSFVVIGIVGSISFCRKMGSPQTYRLTNQASLSINDFVLTIIYPDSPESMIDLKILDAADQHHLLYLLREHWIGTPDPWNPQLGAEIEAALEEAKGSVVFA
jgi:hypothetical protein